MRNILAIAAFFGWFLPAVAADPNGCGSGWNVWIVPDSIPIANCAFGKSCDAHDVCYGRCEGNTTGKCAYLRCKPGGDLYGSDQCKTDMILLQSRIDAWQRKAACDNKLCNDIRSANRGKAVCEALAIIYRDAVKEWGDGAFAGAGPMGVLPAWKQPEADYNAALQQFLSKGSQAQFEAFVRANDEHRSTVKLSHPLRFDPDKGLVNGDVDR